VHVNLDLRWQGTTAQSALLQNDVDGNAVLSHGGNVRAGDKFFGSTATKDGSPVPGRMTAARDEDLELMTRVARIGSDRPALVGVVRVVVHGRNQAERRHRQRVAVLLILQIGEPEPLEYQTAAPSLSPSCSLVKRPP
jgi:hypothetical protein